MPRWICLLAASLMLWAIGAPVRGQEQAYRVPADTKFVVQLNVAAFRNTAFGGRLIELARQKAREELAEDGNGDTPDLDKIHEILGFDPFQEVQGITVSAADYEHPERSLVVAIRLRETTGNLEGLALGLPQYESTDYGKYQIHSAVPESGDQVFAAIHAGADRQKTLLLATQQDAVTNMLDQLDGKSSSSAAFRDVPLSAHGKELLSLEILQLPIDKFEDGPQANIAKILRAISLRVNEAGGDLDLGIMLTADNQQRAEQLRQMAQGFIAMIDFAQSADPDDKDLQRVKQVAHDLKATRDAESVSVTLKLRTSELTKFIEEELSDE
jgi:hypothetical protein